MEPGNWHRDVIEILAMEVSKTDDTEDEDEDEEFNINDYEVIEAKCYYCGEVKPCIYASDPYTSALDEEDTEPELWCMKCFHGRAEDI